MRAFLRLSAVAAVLAVSAGSPALAQYTGGNDPNIFAPHAIVTHDESDHRAWITIQDVGKTRNMDYGHVEAGQYRAWKSGKYTVGSFYYVRFEFRDARDKTICDTRMRVHMPFETANVRGRFNAKTGKCYLTD